MGKEENAQMLLLKQSTDSVQNFMKSANWNSLEESSTGPDSRVSLVQVARDSKSDASVITEKKTRFFRENIWAKKFKCYSNR